MKKIKRLLIITPAFYPLPGGLSEQSYLLAKEFVRKGYSVDVLTEQLIAGLPKKETIDGIEVYRIRQVQKRNIFGLSRMAISLSFFLVKNCFKYSFCIIRTVTSQAIIVGLLKYFRLIRIKTFITAETGGANDEVSAIGKMRFKKMFVFFLNQHDYINSNNGDNYRHYQEIGINNDKLTVIYNGIDVSSYADSTYPDSINSFMFLAELNKEKGVFELLEAFKLLIKKYPDKKLYIGGFGKLEKYIKDFISENCLEEKIEYRGLISNSEKKNFFESADCFVFPSYAEGFGIVTAETIKYKRLLITTKVADLEMIYGNAVLYCEKRSVDGLFKAMCTAVKCYRAGWTNYDEIISKIDIRTTAQRIESLFL